jgi:hypothetical protein
MTWWHRIADTLATIGEKQRWPVFCTRCGCGPLVEFRLGRSGSVCGGCG